MKVVILCGGRGTRLNEHGEAVPKALMKVGDQPLIWHLCKYYAHFGLRDFILCLGFLKDEFSKYFGQSIHRYDEAVDLEPEKGPVADFEGWTVRLVDTLLDTSTGGRLNLLEPLLTSETEFCVTYGDGLSDVNLSDVLAFHRQNERIATLTAINPVSNFGIIDLKANGQIIQFREKPKLSEWVNGGFFVFSPRVFDYLDRCSVLEKEPFENLARDGELFAFRHSGFWKCMDTFKDNIELNDLWASDPPWKMA